MRAYSGVGAEAHEVLSYAADCCINFIVSLRDVACGLGDDKGERTELHS